MQNIEQAYRPYSGVEWHFPCSMRSKWRHRAGLSVLQPPGTPLALLDELHEGQRGDGTRLKRRGRHKRDDTEDDTKDKRGGDDTRGKRRERHIKKMRREGCGRDRSEIQERKPHTTTFSIKQTCRSFHNFFKRIFHITENLYLYEGCH